MSHDKFEAMFTENADLVRRYIARRHIGDDVDDLAVEVFTIAWQRYATIPQGSELPWLYRTAWNVLSNAHRKVVPIVTDTVPDSAETDTADIVVADARLRWCWERLEPRDREVLRLVAWEGLSGRELAEVLDISEGGASAALSRARARLRELWDESATA